MALDFGGLAAGGLSGAMTGASVAGGPGAAVGGGLGALLGLLGGGSNRMQRVKTLSKAQQGILNQLVQMINPEGSVGSGYGEATALQRQLMNPSSQAVQQFTQPYMDQFQNQIIPQLAERFAGKGALGGGLSSSGFAQALGTAGSQLQNQLAALKAGLGQNAAQSLMSQYGNLAGTALSAQPFGYARPQQNAAQGFAQGYMQAGMPGLSQTANSLGDMYGNFVTNNTRLF